MKRKLTKSESLKQLQILRNIGPKMAEELYTLGIKTPEQMMRLNPEKLFEQLQAIDSNVDPCELYVFRGAILDIPWWECKNLGRGQLDQNKPKRRLRKHDG